jgi:hypothetical protein
MDLSNGCDVLASVVEDQHIPNVLCDLGVDIVAEVAHVFKVMPPLEFSYSSMSWCLSISSCLLGPEQIFLFLQVLLVVLGTLRTLWCVLHVALPRWMIACGAPAIRFVVARDPSQYLKEGEVGNNVKLKEVARHWVDHTDKH